MNKSKKIAFLSIFIFTYAHNSFGMLRVLAQRTTPLSSSKFIRPITIKSLPEDLRKELIEASKKIDADCDNSLSHNKEVANILANHLELTERIKNLNTENLAILTAINSDEIYKLHDLRPHFYQLDEWERQLKAKE